MHYTTFSVIEIDTCINYPSDVPNHVFMMSSFGTYGSIIKGRPYFSDTFLFAWCYQNRTNDQHKCIPFRAKNIYINGSIWRSPSDP